jgi:hypothetical protein
MPLMSSRFLYHPRIQDSGENDISELGFSIYVWDTGFRGHHPASIEASLGNRL